MKEEILINTQLGLFFDGLIERPDQLVASFNAEMGNIFDKIPVVIPVPNELQLSEIPVVQLSSTSGVYSCNIARSRVDFFIAGVGKQKFLDIKNDLLERLEKYYNFFSKKSKIKRIGFVTKFFIEDKEQDKTIVKLLNKDFQTLHNGDIHEVYIRYVSRGEINDFKINNFTTVERFFARIPEVGDSIKGILITRDFNTIPEENYRDKFGLPGIKIFVEKSQEKYRLEAIKKILWPI